MRFRDSPRKFGEPYVNANALRRFSKSGNGYWLIRVTVLNPVKEFNALRRAGEVYRMYRCGTVHEFEPKVLENRKGQTLAWLCY